MATFLGTHAAPSSLFPAFPSTGVSSSSILPSIPGLSSCCLKAFQWNGTPTGIVATLPGVTQPAYIAGNPNIPNVNVLDNNGNYNNDHDAAILIVTDILGWTFPNTRLLADYYAREANATVYAPDYFNGEVLPFGPILDGTFAGIDLAGFLERNSRAIREPEIFHYAEVLREKYDKLGVVGFCYGGWAVFRLGAKEHNDKTYGSPETVDGKGKGKGKGKGSGDCPGGTKKGLIDVGVVGHPSLLTKQDIDGEVKPIQILAPEIDDAYTPELKNYTFITLQRNNVPFDYQFFPGVEHGALVRGDPNVPGERAAMQRAKDAAVAWLKEGLHGPYAAKKGW